MQFCGEKRERKRESESKKHREREKSDLIESQNLERPKVGYSKPTIQISCEPKWGSAR